jgi:deoxycytidylate deaminase
VKNAVDAYQDIFLKLAIQTAEKARGNCSPNPFVGAVVVKQNRVISTGWTQPYGFDHAEVQALKRQVQKPEMLIFTLALNHVLTLAKPLLVPWPLSRQRLSGSSSELLIQILWWPEKASKCCKKRELRFTGASITS